MINIASLVNIVKFDRPFYLANEIDLSVDATVNPLTGAKPIISFKTPDIYTTVITGISFGFVGFDYPNISFAPLAGVNLLFDLVIDNSYSYFNRGARQTVGSTVGQLPEYSDNLAFMEVEQNKEITLNIRNTIAPFNLSITNLSDVKVYGELKGYFFTFRERLV